MSPVPPPGRLALLVGGGPAPGLNGVISSVTIEAIEQGIEVIGFQDGFKWLVKGDLSHYRKLAIDDVKGIYPRGGSVLGTSRTNPAKAEEPMRNVLETLRKLNVTMLVTIGGDDTAFSGSQVYLRAGGAIRVAHVPKTIDNDLPLPGSAPTFGYETARHLGVGIVRNLAEDARTTSRWYLIVSMGRAAGHLALGIGKAAAATLTIIPEEFRGRPVSIDDICDILIGSIVKRRSANLNYGVAVLAEGLIEAIGEKGLATMIDDGQLGRYGCISRDDHNHLRLGDIDFGRMMKDALTKKLRALGLEITIIDKELGYELRCADPIPFDAEYTRDLGYGAVHFLMSDESARYGAVISLEGGRLRPIRFEDMINPETKRMKPRKVDVDGESYRCARAYMIRLEPRDLAEPARLGRLAEAANMAPEQFRRRFAPVVAHG